MLSRLLSVVLILVVVGNIYILPHNISSNYNNSGTSTTKFQHRYVSGNCSTGIERNDVSTLTIFTSFPYLKNKLNVNLNSLRNWKHLDHSPQLVLFTNDRKVALTGFDTHWNVQNVKEDPVTKVPALRTMFVESMNLYDTSFYMYANADIVFDLYIVDVLSSIEKFLKSKNLQNKPVLIVGQRTNFNVSSINMAAPEAWRDIMFRSYRVYTRFHTDAIDYFITNRAFPWDEVLPLVIGRVGYDNWIIAYARFRGFITIDASAAISAIHQTTNIGNFEGFRSENWDFNRNYIYKSSPPFPYGVWGRTGCCTYQLSYDDCSRVVVIKRPDVPSECNRLNFFPMLQQALGKDVFYMGHVKS